MKPDRLLQTQDNCREHQLLSVTQSEKEWAGPQEASCVLLAWCLTSCGGLAKSLPSDFYFPASSSIKWGHPGSGL